MDFKFEFPVFQAVLALSCDMMQLDELDRNNRKTLITKRTVHIQIPHEYFRFDFKGIPRFH